MIWFLLIYIATVNAVAYFLMRADKQRAKNKQWRIEEAVFFALCAIGGFIGVHLGMQHFRHKTQHWQFKAAVIISAVLFLIVLPLVFWQRMIS
ncbi:hypothetical protein A4G18_01595 [Pasteurellaceae bacterium Pebbles2]|nr:hypothetical protein [Pasteurellaceae bacterium Pebbles2]